MQPINRDILAVELGRIMLDSGLSADLENLMKQTRFHSAETLAQITAILDNTSLSDFECIEEIVELLWRVGIRTSRHDFG